MTITNTSNGASNNTADTFSLSISDTSSHDFPDTNGDDSVGGDPWDGRTAEFVVAYIKNNQDQDLTATLKRSPDPESTVEVTDVSDVTVAAGDTEALIANPGAPHGAFRVVVEFVTAPTGTSDTVVEFDYEA